MAKDYVVASVEKSLMDLGARAAYLEAVERTIANHRSLKPGWYASSGSVDLTRGPYRTRREAEESMRLSPRERADQKITTNNDYPYPLDMRVWKETRRKMR
jgi:hypothetical protein